MGREMMRRSTPFRQSLEKSEKALRSLQDGPSWSLLEELAAEPDSSRVSQARFSQPLCTAVQIALTDLLHAVGVRLDAVVGHSSGEIGAAYAAGVIDAKHAVGIAYYRGLVADLAQGTDGQGGGMMAVGMSYDAAASFCSQPGFRGRISVAASNSPTSVTLSGDSDAIWEAKQLMEATKTFARILRVETAYHSHHMRCCEAKYLSYLRQLDIRIRTPRPGCVWFSSVYPRAMTPHRDQLDQLKDQYWIDNMSQAVLFSQAVQCALETAGPFALALEIGPHPALKGPVNQICKSPSTPGMDCIDTPSMSYAGCLERGSRDTDVLSNALALVWSHLGPSNLNLDVWNSGLSRPAAPKPRMLNNLPTYSWHHDQPYWHESRSSRNYRLGQHTPHELLGRLRETCRQEMTWRNFLRLEELPWLRGHVFQGQVVFPGAGYVSMAVQAAMAFAQERGADVGLVEVRDMTIFRALVIEEDTPGVEMLFTVKERERSAEEDSTAGENDMMTIQADFTTYACSDQRNMSKCSQGCLLIHLAKSASLPHSRLLSTNDGGLPSLDVAKFFSVVSGLGITYEGPFRALKSIERARGNARATASWSTGDLGHEHLLHPAVLDVAFQVGFASFLSMAEKAMGTTHLPAHVRSVVVDVSRLEARGTEHHHHNTSGEQEDEICVASQLVGKGDGSMIEVDIDVHGPKSTASRSIQIEGLTFKSVGAPLALDDRLLFSKTVWGADAAAGIAAPEPRKLERDEIEYIDAVERTALFFLRTLQEGTPPEDIESFKPQHQALFRGIDLLIAPIREGRHSTIKKSWLNDTREVIEQFAKRYDGSVDLALLTAVGENLPKAVRGQTEILEHMLQGNLLGRLYTEGRGFAICNEYAAHFMRQISFKFPKARILEIGAGTGGTTSSVLGAIGDAYVSYTYTDISAGFFEKAAERFAASAHKMEYRTLNAEHSPLQQGFKEGSYDIIIAANVLHATSRLAATMRNVRSLLRPGGYLIAIEVTGNMLREPGLMGGLEGWWLGEEDGRFPSPGISARGWDHILHETGFSGVDTIAYDMPDISRHNCSTFVTQAMDERLEFLRDPMARTDLVPDVSGPVLIIGGQTLPVSKCVQRVKKQLRVWGPRVQIFADLDDLDREQIDTTGSQILYLGELDAPIFSRPLTQRRLESLQELLASANNVLWVTSERRADTPEASMAVGIGRALQFELPHVRMQFLDFEKGTAWDSDTMVQNLLRMALLSSLHEGESTRTLWSHEREIVVVDDVTLISRVIMDDQANEQFNAGRRRVERRVGPREDVEISYSGSKPSIVLAERNSAYATDQEVFDVALSTPLFIGDDSISCFLAFGRRRGSDDAQAIFFSNKDESTAQVSHQNFLGLGKDARMEPQQLSAIASAILGQACGSLMRESGTTLVYAPADGVDEAIQKEAARLGRKVMFVGLGTTQVDRRPGWLIIHPLERARTARAVFPEDTAALLYFSGHGRPPKKILEALPNNCGIQMVNPGPARDGRACLEAALAMAPSLTPCAPQVTAVTSVEQLSPGSNPILKILDWRQRDWLNATVPPLNTRNFFASDKTYLLVGMTGELGQSLCQFMIDCGARYIVLASRNPPLGCPNQFRRVDRRADLQVKMVKMDVTSREQVHAVISDIRETMPEIAGVANAALVLEDSLFVNTTVPSLEKQWRPKVVGTSHLDEELSGCELDFFLCFSSLASVFGNAGQSIYHAANMFTTSLIERRRRSGLAGSVVHVGMIVDAGYVARSTRSGANIEEHLRSQFYMPLSEGEFHHLILRAVLAGRPTTSPEEGHDSNGEITIGIQRFVDDPDALTRPQWYHDPRLSHMVLPMSSSDSQTSSTGSTGTKKELLSMLETTVSVPGATEIYRQLFCLKVESMMKIPAASVDCAAPLSNLGLDSLLAVEIRAWLLKDMRVDIPLLGILSRDSVLSICAVAAQQLVQQSTTADKQSDTKVSETSSLETSSITTMLDNNNMGKTDSSDDTTSIPSTRTTTEPGLASPSSRPMTPSSDELAPAAASEVSCSPLRLGQSVGIGLPKPGLDQVDDSPVLERVERMSYSQASMHFLHNYLDDATTFNVVAHYKVRGPLSVSRLQKALEKVMARHDAYRTRFYAEAGGLEPRQCVAATKAMIAGPGLPRLVHLSSTSRSQTRTVFQDLSQRKWQLARGEAFQCVLVTHPADDGEGTSGSECNNTLVIGCHHIIMDGMSWHIFLNDLDRAYRLLPLEPVPFTYADFSRQQLEDLQSGRLDESLAFWMRRLVPIPGVIPLLPLSHRRSRKLTRVYENHTVQAELALQIDQQVKNAAQRYRATPMQFYLVGLQVLMLQLLDLDDGEELCIGVTDAGRGTSGHFGETVGHFTNLLPIKLPVGKESRMAEVVSKTSQIVAEAYEHAHVPLDLILEKLQIRRSMAHTPLFQIAFNYRVGDLLSRALGNCELDLVAYRDARTPYDLTLNITQSSSTGSQLVEITSNAHLYTRSATQRILDMYTDLLDTLLSVDKNTRLCDLKLLSPTSNAACQDDVHVSRGPKTEHHWPPTLTERIQEVWNDFPTASAIKDDAASLTYQELRARVRDIVRALHGITHPGMHVGVLCNPGIDSHAIMLALLWVGAVYIPLDVTLPAKRHQAMMDACKPGLLVFHGPTSSAAEALLESRRGNDRAIAALPTFNLAEVTYSSSETAPQNGISPAEKAMTGEAKGYSFVLFTSGSTGTPKGIKLSQAGVMNYAASKSALLGIAPGVRVLQQSSSGFDMAIAQAFNAFANAGTLVVAPLQARGDPSMIAKLMASEAIDFTLATPTEYLMLANYANDILRQSTSWRYACSGGEAVTEGLIDQLQRLELPQLSLTDCYGPTEISCAATFRKINLGSSLTAEEAGDDFYGESSVVGRPLPNTSIYIVGDDGEPLVSGQQGEICIAGCGVAMGYLEEALNLGKFVQNRFATREDAERGWRTIYKTGDKGCILPDGSLVFLGRMDLELVKLRGLRIELGEVSRAIVDASHGALTDAIVSVRGDPEFLVAHVAFASGGTAQEQQTLLDRLASDLPLPRYMIPAHIIPLEQLPTTPSGKVDRLAIASLPLPPASREEEHTASQQPLTVAQGELRLLWREVLGGDAVIRADTDFFTVGGSSLLLVRLQNLLKERMGIQIPLHKLYECSTLDRMAALASRERSLVVDQQDIDWERETAIPSEIQQLLLSIPNPPSVPPSSHIRVLLTGATSFLGSEILRALIAEEDVAEIHCIALPAESHQKVLSLSDKITAYTGSLHSPTLGLSSAEQRLLQASAHVIIHAGSQGHCLNNYRSVRQANFVSTQFLAALALPNRTPIHFISSPRVILQSGLSSSTGTTRSMAAHPPDADGSQGFTASKWASERFLERVVAATTTQQAQQQQQQPHPALNNRPLPVVIHRACSLIGDRAPHDDAMNSVIRFSVLSGRVPRLRNAQGFFDFKDVVDVAGDIVRHVVDSAAVPAASSPSSDGGVVFQHHSSNVRIHFNELAQRLEMLHGRTFATVSMSEWLRGALQLGIEELIVSYLEANLAGGGTLMFPYLGE